MSARGDSMETERESLWLQNVTFTVVIDAFSTKVSRFFVRHRSFPNDEVIIVTFFTNFNNI